MLWWLIPLIIFLAVLCAVGALIFRKVPQLRVIDVNAIPEEKVKKVKEKIILEKLRRVSGKRMEKLAKAGAEGLKGASKVGRRLVQRLYALEQHYKKLQQGDAGDHAKDNETVRRLLDEAGEFIRQGEYFQAEKRFIEIISHHPKHALAYEELGNLYILDKKYDQARETLTFALKLQSDNASAEVSFGELELAVGDGKEALEHFARAVELRPHNPKYLDFYVETALKVGSAVDAKKGLRMLRDVNPENNKLEEFEKRIDEMIEKKLELRIPDAAEEASPESAAGREGPKE